MHDGKNGIITEFGNTKMIKEAITKLLYNKKLSKEMGVRGKKFSKEYDWDFVISKFEKLYHSIV